MKLSPFFNQSSNDESVFQFLEQFSHNALLTDINLELDYDGPREFNALLQFLPIFLPLVTSIDSIELDDRNMVARLIKKNFGREMMTAARVLIIRFAGFLTYKIKIILIYSHVSSDSFDFGNWCRRWLQTPREDNKPRVLIAANNHLGTTARFTSFVKNIKKV
jgi:hypothetical protein